MTKLSSLSYLFICGFLFLSLLSTASANDDLANDPFEGFNRTMFGIHMTLDKYAIKPAALAYSHVPNPIKQGVTNFTGNIGTPVSMTNQLLQAKITDSTVSLGRFLINSTIGIFGIFDVATKIGLAEPQPEDMGQTLATYGVGEGPYLFIPLLGPTTIRDSGGRIADWVSSPLHYSNLTDGEIIAYYAVEGVSFREQGLELLDSLESTSADLYISYRNLYRQSRKDKINDGISTIDDLPTIDDNWDEE